MSDNQPGSNPFNDAAEAFSVAFEEGEKIIEQMRADIGWSDAYRERVLFIFQESMEKGESYMHDMEDFQPEN